ncbi:MAG: C4-dicarboxylate ABC transporter, partial [Campylobacter concisus]|nr:C4-dicarboxylate ABC transporter [Campylobacter concisus]
MDIMLILQIIVLFGGIYLGVKLGGMGVGYAGGLGVVVLALLGMKVDMKDIPMDVILIIASVISAITALQVAGGLDYLVQVATKILRKNPKQINFLAPIVTYFLTILAGTGHTAFSMIPVIVEVAKTQNIKPSAPLALSVVSSQVAITASPISAAFVAMSGLCEKLGVSYPVLLFICISTTFVAMIITAFIINKFYDLDLSKDPIYQDRLAKGLVAEVKDVEYHEPKPYAKRSVAIFAVGV